MMTLSRFRVSFLLANIILMNEINPYAAPNVSAQAKSITKDGFVWRSVNTLVMRRDAKLPLRCVKSNEPVAEIDFKRKLVWQPGWVAIMLLISPLIYIIVSLIVQKKATIYTGLSDEWRGKRMTRMLIATFISLAGILLFAGGIVMANDMSVFAVIGGIFLFIGGLIFGAYASRMVSASKISDTHIWLRGVCPEYLNELPELPVNEAH